jgi:hypothetical protein
MATGVADYIGSLRQRDRRVEDVEPALEGTREAEPRQARVVVDATIRA